MNEKTAGSGAEKTTLNLSLTVEDKKFLKVYAARNGTTVSGVIQDFVQTLKSAQAESTSDLP